RYSARMCRRRPSGEARDCQVHSAPEQMDWAALSNELRAELLEHAIALREPQPEPMDGVGIVRPLPVVLWKRHDHGQLVRSRENMNAAAAAGWARHTSLAALRPHCT